jgi:hypothetical protein
MTFTVANTATTNTFDYWRTRTNELADAMTRLVVSVDSNTATGNAAVNGHFFANTLVATYLRGGTIASAGELIATSNVTVNGSFFGVSTGASNTYINTTAIYVRTSTSNAVINSTSLLLGNTSANVNLSPSGLFINGVQLLTTQALVNVQTSGTSAQEVDNITKSVHRGADYTFTITDNGANAYHMAKVMVIHNAGDGILNEFGVIWSNTNLGSFTANANATHVRTYFTPTVANTQVKGIKTVYVL